MITFFKRLKNHLDIQWHLLIFKIKHYMLTTIVLYTAYGLSYGFELFVFESPKTKYDTYCLLGLTLFTPSNKNVYLEINLLWIFNFLITFKTNKL